MIDGDPTHSIDKDKAKEEIEAHLWSAVASNNPLSDHEIKRMAEYLFLGGFTWIEAKKMLVALSNEFGYRDVSNLLAKVRKEWKWWQTSRYKHNQLVRRYERDCVDQEIVCDLETKGLYYLYYWYLTDSVTKTTTRSRKIYGSIKEAKESAERYAMNEWSRFDPEDISLSVYRSDGVCVYLDYVVPDVGMEGLNVLERCHFMITKDEQKRVETFTYRWIGLDLSTGEIFDSPRRHYHSLESVERSIKLHITKHWSDRDPEDLIFEVIKTNDRGRESLVYTKAKRDLGEGVGIDEWYRFLNLGRGDIAGRMCVEEVGALLEKVKKDGIMEDIDAEELDPLQELKLANVIHRMKRSR